MYYLINRVKALFSLNRMTKKSSIKTYTVPKQRFLSKDHIVVFLWNDIDFDLEVDFNKCIGQTNEYKAFFVWGFNIPLRKDTTKIVWVLTTIQGDIIKGKIEGNKFSCLDAADIYPDWEDISRVVIIEETMDNLYPHFLINEAVYIPTEI